MPNLEEFVDFNPEKDIPSLEGKVIFITGGTAGLGKASVLALALHKPAHIYFSGRNAEAAKSLIAEVLNFGFLTQIYQYTLDPPTIILQFIVQYEVQNSNPSVGMTFVKMDMNSLASVKKACAEFSHDRLDILMCNAGVMYIPPGLSKDGFENHFAINHLAHAMIIQELLPVMTRTAERPDSDVRLVSLTSTAWMGHPWHGVTFSTLRTTQTGFMGASFRYGQSKLANILYAAEFARRYPDSKIKCVSVHPGPVHTDLTSTLTFGQRIMIQLVFWYLGVSFMEVAQGRLSQIWAAAGARRDQLVNGAYYTPVGKLANGTLDKTAKSTKLAGELWTFTQDVLAKF
ncbi:putative oxidoreductase [Lachnellula suecica]|uniref:Putative oxidoreductase n=1 Tax=Lachnellula suecica TaxID=602035 RepID=A0A8T9BY64_9HELO|nr:putative oxidoreductase [Lachnellula suecica]